jgi:NADPH:quinone reductase-like Zn-dependent oxidoreductase
VLAQTLSRFGDSDAFELKEIAVPALRAGCALVRIAATSVNHVDCKLRQHGSAGHRICQICAMVEPKRG